MFAVIDIETTGGNPNAERIIEIAILIFDGNKIIEEYSTLINPEKQISPFISTFTGITNHMVKDAPKFEDIADRVLKLTHGHIFVAHNVRFDYNFIKHEFKKLNIEYARKTLDTVQLSRKTFPQYRSHSLGNICRDLGIQIDNRHRALGDAKATTILLQKIIAQYNENFLEQVMHDDVKKLYLPKKLDSKILENLSEEAGIIFFYNQEKDVIAVQSAKNIKEHIFKIYKDKPADKYKKLLYEETAELSFEITGNELLAILLEENYLQSHLPKYNKIQKHYSFNVGLFADYDENGFYKLAIKMLDEAEEPIIKFTSKLKAERMLNQIVNASKLGPIFKKIESKFHYNQRIEELLAKFKYPSSNFFLILNGRSGTEKCAINIEKGNLNGYVFFEPTYIQNILEIKSVLKPIGEYSNTKKDIVNYIRKNNKYIQIITY
jgi:DNA polymerase-3 subunit epsilon